MFFIIKKMFSVSLNFLVYRFLNSLRTLSISKAGKWQNVGQVAGTDTLNKHGLKLFLLNYLRHVYEALRGRDFHILMVVEFCEWT